MQPILKVDLSTGLSEEYHIPEKWEKDFLGGASLAARLLYDSLTPELDALSPGAPLLFINGPLSGTSGPTTGRSVICGKGSATGLWAESNIGGFWGPELRFTGYDGLWITGKAKEPIYLWINEGKLEIRQAAHLWGQMGETNRDGRAEGLAIHSFSPEVAIPATNCLWKVRNTAKIGMREQTEAAMMAP